MQFGTRRDVFGSSACRPPDSRGNVPRAFKPGRKTRLAVPHRFRKRGRQKLIVRVDSGGCLAPLTSVYQTVTVPLPPAPASPRAPIVVGRPTREAPPGRCLPPILPLGSGRAGLLPRAVPGGAGYRRGDLHDRLRVPRLTRTEPSSSIVQCGLWATSHGWPSGSMKTPE